MLMRLIALLGICTVVSGCLGGGGDGMTSSPPSRAMPNLYSWMSPEIADAWQQGYFGQGTQITVVDQFSGSSRFTGDLGTGQILQRHGEWVSLQVSMLAPDARLVNRDFTETGRVVLSPGQLNVLNLSYGMFAASGTTNINWSQQEGSIIAYAHEGAAVVVKAAGNDAVAIGAANTSGLVDYLNRDLIGAQAAIFVGALDRNGTVTDQAQLASYSNFAGTDVTVQNQFLTVGVRGDLTGLYGTSFAAPIVSGYAAVLGSKFPTATATQITNQLLSTARTDTIMGYNAAIHGRGEASITRALAPAAIR
jgi:subtilisin family serine protease